MCRRVLRPILPSLGASGAVLACFAAAACFAPDKQVAFIFAPTASFPIINGLQVHFRGLANSASGEHKFSCCTWVLLNQFPLVVSPTLSSLNAGTLQGMVAVDSLGILFRWQFFDHWAHLGGTGFGWWYATRGSEQIWESMQLREWLLDQREELMKLVAQR